jgi:energy-coupling factor transporter ATP-binding protein EcfA2
VRLKAVTLTWFRGAAHRVTLDAKGKSVVVYGENAAGKSSFVDAIEYAIHGKLGHLSHEYSGYRQEKAVPNTHTPIDAATELALGFKDGSELHIGISRDGTHTRHGAESVNIPSWDYRRIVLRQDEVSRFIHERKGDKYSALLPLFGLGDLEVAAENLRQLAKAVGQKAGVERKQGELRVAKQRRKEVFGEKSDEEIESEVAELHGKYCLDSEVMELDARCEEVEAAIARFIGDHSKETKRHIVLHAIGDVDITDLIAAVRSKNSELAKSTEPLIWERLRVLASAQHFAEKLEPGPDLSCPACGSTVPVDDFQEHVRKEQERLKEISATYMERGAAISSAIDGLKAIKGNLAKTEIAEWRDQLRKREQRVNLEWTETTDPERLRDTMTEDDLAAIEKHCSPIVAAAKLASVGAPPEAQELTNDEKSAAGAKAMLEAVRLREDVSRAERLSSFLRSTENAVRDAIRERSLAAIAEVSGDVKIMWEELHPGSSIKEVRLHVPDNDKAIDIHLTFHGKKQESPRLTLSEGFRNSLGLCIFLAMAKREGATDRPLVLDDVVISLDREHRGMVARVLEKHFADRQVILLTHDRDWFADLGKLLDRSRWIPYRLLPWEDPTMGIRWSHKTGDFDDARALLKDRPDSAGNDARKIMDIELAMIAEKLQIRLPYLRGERNDFRTFSEFISRITSAGKTCLQKMESGTYVSDDGPLDTLEDARRMLESWANRGSHSHDVVWAEASQLIDVCEAALATLSCDSCGKPIWYADAANAKSVQCTCGTWRWRYSKDSGS